MTGDSPETGADPSGRTSHTATGVRSRFRPRYRGLAYAALGVGGSLGAVALAALDAALVPLVTGATGVVLGAAYLMSPTWKLEVVVDGDALVVRTPKAIKLRLQWSEVIRVVASPSTTTCFVDGGAPERSLLVPGDGAPAPYDLDNKRALFDAIVARVPSDKITTVETLDSAR